MSESGDLAKRFETYRGRLRKAAYLLLGVLDETDEIVEEAREALLRGGLSESVDPFDWLMAMVARRSFELLRSRRSKGEDALAVRLPDLIVEPIGGGDPANDELFANPMGVSMLVAFDTLAPVERLAYVLHERFDIGLDVIASIAGRTMIGVEQALERAREWVEEMDTPHPETDPKRQRAVVDAFLAASADSDVTRLEELCAPNALRRMDHGDTMPGGAATLVRGARQVAVQSLGFSSLARDSIVVNINGVAGLATILQGELASVLSFTVSDDKIVELDVLADRARLATVDVDGLAGDR